MNEDKENSRNVDPNVEKQIESVTDKSPNL